MKRNFHIAIGTLWVAPVVLLLQYGLVWDRLPMKLATHFVANGQPNGWMSREMAAAFPVLILLPILLVATLVLARIRNPEGGAWAILGVFYVVSGIMVFANQQILAFNLHGDQVQVGPLLIGVLASVLVLLFVFVGSGRGKTLPPADIVAEEVHRSGIWAAGFLLMLGVFEFIALRIPEVRIPLGLTGLIFAALAAVTWFGFHYRFTHAGVEIRTLGFRLRSIPKEHIREYLPSTWSWMGGYGIRGIGEDRAYVWSNSGVRIRTFAGNVFLGHREPERLIHDLDVLTGAAR